MPVVVVGGGERRRGNTHQPTTMTADNITVERLASLQAMLDVAACSIARLAYDAALGDIDPAEAAAIVNETIQNLVNEAR